MCSAAFVYSFGAQLYRGRLIVAYWTQVLSVSLAWLSLSLSRHLCPTDIQTLHTIHGTKGILCGERSMAISPSALMLLFTSAC